MNNKQNFLIICLGSVGSGYQQGQDINKGNISERERGTGIQGTSWDKDSSTSIVEGEGIRERWRRKILSGAGPIKLHPVQSEAPTWRMITEKSEIGVIYGHQET